MEIRVYIGVIGSGKTYAAKRDCDIQLAFADRLRKDVWTMLGWEPKTDEEYGRFKETAFTAAYGWPTADRQPQFTGRDLLQRYGTEVRRAEKDSHWVDAMILTLIQHGMWGTVGITDCRFPNEVKGLIEFCEKENREMSYLGVDGHYELNFVHCDYHSDRYCATETHESEKLAQTVLAESLRDVDFDINKYIREEYG